MLYYHRNTAFFAKMLYCSNKANEANVLESCRKPDLETPKHWLYWFSWDSTACLHGNLGFIGLVKNLRDTTKDHKSGLCWTVFSARFDSPGRCEAAGFLCGSCGL